MKNKSTKISIFIISLALLSYTLYGAFFMGYFSPKSFEVNGFTIPAPRTSFLFGVAEGEMKVGSNIYYLFQNIK